MKLGHLQTWNPGSYWQEGCMPSPSIPMLSWQTNCHGHIHCFGNTELCFPTGRDHCLISPEIWYCLRQHFTFSLHYIFSLCYWRVGLPFRRRLGKRRQKVSWHWIVHCLDMLPLGNVLVPHSLLYNIAGWSWLGYLPWSYQWSTQQLGRASLDEKCLPWSSPCYLHK